ncbi:MAG: hypothetical protein Q8N60_02010 [Candidatus Diapherotrites archaeon]|nr:hypothetical protein [Candidatus Diapherotrites archaeon]
MNTIGKPLGERGFIFSIDLTVSFIAMLLMVLLILMHASVLKDQQVESINKFDLQRNAIFLADSLVKNNDAAQPLLGSALFDAEKHRVLSNQLDEALLLNATRFEKDGFFVNRLSFKDEFGIEQAFFDGLQGSNCLALDRVVLLNGVKGLLAVTVCEK